MRSYRSKTDIARSAQPRRRKKSHSTSTTSTVEEKVVAALSVGWCAPTITPELLAVLSHQKKPNDLLTIYETPLQPGLLDAKLLPLEDPVKKGHPGSVLVPKPGWWATCSGDGGWVEGYIDEVEGYIDEAYYFQKGMYMAAISPLEAPYIKDLSKEDKLAAAEALEKAADLLLFKGWIKGALFEYDTVSMQQELEEKMKEVKAHNEKELYRIYNKKVRTPWTYWDVGVAIDPHPCEVFFKLSVVSDSGGTAIVQNRIMIPYNFDSNDFKEWVEQFL